MQLRRMKETPKVDIRERWNDVNKTFPGEGDAEKSLGEPTIEEDEDGDGELKPHVDGRA